MAPPLEPRTVQEWGAVAPQWVGLGGLLSLAGFWAATGRVSGLFVSAFLGLIAVGQGAEAVALMKRVPRQATVHQQEAARGREA